MGTSTRTAMTPEEYAACDGVALAQLIARGEVSVAEVAAAARLLVDREVRAFSHGADIVQALEKFGVSRRR